MRLDDGTKLVDATHVRFERPRVLATIDVTRQDVGVLEQHTACAGAEQGGIFAGTPVAVFVQETTAFVHGRCDVVRQIRECIRRDLQYRSGSRHTCRIDRGVFVLGMGLDDVIGQTPLGGVRVCGGVLAYRARQSVWC